MAGTAYIDRQNAELRLDGSAIAVYANGERAGTIPLAPLGRLVLLGDLLIRASLLGRLADESVDVVFLSGKRQQYRGRFVGRPHRHARLRLRQYELSSGPFAFERAREWVSRKLAKQVTLLKDAAVERPAERTALLRAAGVAEASAENVLSATSLETLRGLEGSAAAAYFAALTRL